MHLAKIQNINVNALFYVNVTFFDKQMEILFIMWY